MKQREDERQSSLSRVKMNQIKSPHKSDPLAEYLISLGFFIDLASVYLHDLHSNGLSVSKSRFVRWLTNKQTVED